MKKNRKLTLSSLLITCLMTLTLTLVVHADDTPVNVGTTKDYAILAYSTITNAGNSIVYGDIGLHSGTAVTGYDNIVHQGEMNISNDTALGAKNDLVTAYNDITGRTPVEVINTELGGKTLPKGVYQSGTFGITGTLILDAENDPNALFIFIADSTLITATNSTVSLVNGANWCQIYWAVGSSATIETGSDFSGRIYAQQTITLNANVTVKGQLLVRNGAVNLNDSTVDSRCPAEPVYDISYQLDGGMNSTANPNTYTIHDTVIFDIPTKENHTFEGWYDSATDGNEITQIPSGSFGNKTVFAYWTETLPTTNPLPNDGETTDPPSIVETPVLTDSSVEVLPSTGTSSTRKVVSIGLIAVGVAILSLTIIQRRKSKRNQL